MMRQCALEVFSVARYYYELLIEWQMAVMQDGTSCKTFLWFVALSALYCDDGGFVAGVLWHPQNAAKPAGWHARAAYFGRNAACPCAKAVPPPWQRRHACVSAVHLLTVGP